MRLFIALNFDEKTKESILAAQKRLRAYGKGRFSPKENFHLTLAFIGEASKDDLPAIVKAMESVEFPSLEPEFDRTGFFARDGEIWWIGLKEDPALMKLQKDLVKALKAEGIRTDAKRFRPHITLARDMHIGDKAVRESILPEPFRTRVDRISLMNSNYPAKEVRYTELRSVCAKEGKNDQSRV
ncbi:MAG: RNA 2',3'-cyclic phosphodiesterase [Firmicutes bacterium]|nr:RNA 2',3'-cyclic phosphodiesterase [Bacillota bacterium]